MDTRVKTLAPDTRRIILRRRMVRICPFRHRKPDISNRQVIPRRGCRVLCRCQDRHLSGHIRNHTLCNATNPYRPPFNQCDSFYMMEYVCQEIICPSVSALDMVQILNRLIPVSLLRCYGIVYYVECFSYLKCVNINGVKKLGG